MAALPQPDRATFVDVNRIRLRVWEWGDPGAPMVLAAHGAYDHGRMFDEIASQVAGLGYHVRAVDLRGHGDSGATHTGHTFDAAVLDLGMLTVDHGAPVGLLGHSMGAGMLSRVAATWPAHVRWLVSLDSLGPPGSDFADLDPGEAATGGWAGLVKTLGRDQRVFPDLAAMKAQRSAVNVRLPERWLDHLVEHGTVAVEGGHSWKCGSIFSTWLPDGFEPSWVTSDFARVECPVLALMGVEDDAWVFPAEEIPERSSHLRDLRLRTVPGAGHYVHLEQPDIVMDAVRTFLAEVDG